MVLPCVPPMAIDHLSRISSASISARRTTGISRAARGRSSGLSFLTADETTTTCARRDSRPRGRSRRSMPSVAQPLHVGAVGDVAALHRVAEIVQHLGDAAHADAADADEMDRADVSGRASCRVLSWLPRAGCCRRIASARSCGARRDGRAPIARRRPWREPPGCVDQRRRRSRQTVAAKLGCGTTSAAPAAASAPALAVWWSSIA